MAHDLSTKGELTWIIKTDHRLEINPKELALKNSIHTVADFFFLKKLFSALQITVESPGGKQNRIIAI